MKYEYYELTNEADSMHFEFVSEGIKGYIPKIIAFTQMNNDRLELYNLAFGDKTLDGEIDDTVVSNNGDTEKVLATVAKAVTIFTDNFPSAWVYATGSTSSRTRLYQIIISKNLEEINRQFVVLGLKDMKPFPFEKNVNYDAFIIKRRV